MSSVTGFAPLLTPNARVLVLGSMPGVASLAAGQYYAHPRNAFWPVMASILGFAENLDYAQRVSALMNRGIAVWDVLKHCSRSGSADTAIDPTSMVINDFSGLFAQCPRIALVACNGAAAWRLYRRHVLPNLSSLQQGITLLQLPSTSPAYAALSVSDKRRAWGVLDQWHQAAL